jgi:hypothetical protein
MVAIVTEMKIVKFDAREHHGTALIAPDDSVWIAVAPPWWDLATRLWWFFAPIARKAIVHLNTPNGKVRTQALCIARSHVRIKNLPKEEG